MRTWQTPTPLQPPPELLELADGSALLAELLARRGIRTVQQARAFLDPAAYTFAAPGELPGIAQVAGRLEEAIRRGEAICVWGDFDVDGQTATATLVGTLRALGADVRYYIPVRERESHGVHLAGLERVVAEGTKIILTCDTGISAHAAAEFLRQRGVEFLITDHHDLPAELPRAAAIINPKLLPQGHPLAGLPGAGVAFELARALFTRFDRAEEAEQFVDLCALGIVADLALHTGDCRPLVQMGLQAMRTHPRLALATLMELAELNPAGLTEAHIGFVLAPRINALGRLADANQGVEFLLTRDAAFARVNAAMLEGLNARRKLLTDQVFQAAHAQLEETPALLRQPALVLAGSGWHGGVIGIVASRLVERYNRPVVLLSVQGENAARGSARSVEGVNITECIGAAAHLLESFGGHPMAAGLALKVEHIDTFRSILNQAVMDQWGAERAEAALEIDAFTSLDALSVELADSLQKLAPFGPGNPAPVLAVEGVRIHNTAKLGRGGEHLQVIVEDRNNHSQKVLWWQGAGMDLPPGWFDLAFTLRASDYRGARQLAVEWVDARWQPETALPVIKRPPLEIHDLRGAALPLVRVKELSHRQGVVIWAEGAARRQLKEQGIDSCARFEMQPAAHVVVWSTPAAPELLQQVVAATGCVAITLIGVDPGMDLLQPFAERLAGLVKTALRQGGQISLDWLAAGCAQREEAARTGLRWLAARGDITLHEGEGGALTLQAGGEADPALAERLAFHLHALLEETRAYRQYFARAEAKYLVAEG